MKLNLQRTGHDQVQTVHAVSAEAALSYYRAGVGLGPVQVTFLTEAQAAAAEFARRRARAVSRRELAEQVGRR